MPDDTVRLTSTHPGGVRLHLHEMVDDTGTGTMVARRLPGEYVVPSDGGAIEVPRSLWDRWRGQNPHIAAVHEA